MFNKIVALVLLGSFLISCNSGKKAVVINESSESEWIDMFNGKDLDNWTPKIYHHETGENYKNTFKVKGGTIEVNYDDYSGFGDRYGHLFYKKPFSSFHMTWDYRFTEQWLEDAASYTYRNSGVMFHSQAPETILKEQDWPISVEWQMLAEEKEGVLRPTGNMCSPGTDVFFEGKKDPRHCVNSTSPTFKWDEWVKADLIVYGDSLVIHMVNDEEVLRYTLPQVGGGVAKGFDPKYKQDGKALTEGYIGLQSEGQGVIFKNLKIKKL